MNNPKTVAILGAGAWGASLANLAAANGHQVRVWSRQGSQTLQAVLKDVHIVLSAISMIGVRDVASQVQCFPLSPETIFVTATKGLDPQNTCTPSQIWQTIFPKNAVVVLSGPNLSNPKNAVVVLSGPNLSKEIQMELPAATVVASNIPTAAEVVQLVFSSHRFRVYTNPDPLGVELGGTLKNVIAIAAGVCDGLQLGMSLRSQLVCAMVYNWELMPKLL